MEFSTDPNSTFYQQAMEVKVIRDNLTEEQKAIANFWVDTPGITGTPSGHWVSIENQLVSQRNLKLDSAAQMYALVGVALGDAFIACWNLKYQVMLLRPETYIKRYIRKTWAPYIQTPPFPEYPSGHSVASAAAAEVLTSLFGTVAFKDNTHKLHNQPPRYFTSFEAAATEAAISRLYGGIHYRAAIENGLRQGRCVGATAVSRVQMRPRGNG
jgi:membrane-associated phospholipid phosphatase